MIEELQHIKIQALNSLNRSICCLDELTLGGRSPRRSSRSLSVTENPVPCIKKENTNISSPSFPRSWETNQYSIDTPCWTTDRGGCRCPSYRQLSVLTPPSLWTISSHHPLGSHFPRGDRWIVILQIGGKLVTSLPPFLFSINSSPTSVSAAAVVWTKKSTRARDLFSAGIYIFGIFAVSTL